MKRLYRNCDNRGSWEKRRGNDCCATARRWGAAVNAGPALLRCGPGGRELVLLFTCLLAISLACERFLHTLAFARLQIEGVTLDFLDDVLLLYLPLEATQSILERLTFLHSNFCQMTDTSKLPNGVNS
jgi:hypothetical protein